MNVFDTLLRDADVALSNGQPFTLDTEGAIARAEETLASLRGETNTEDAKQPDE
jgi:hypothetical protein